ncbi:MAG TPA: UDP-3-O-(3-hydroxymyristoyl)glucosamine N-acyltransferase [Verrucomicrobiae bacterium]
MITFTVAEIAAKIRGQVKGDSNTAISGLTSADRAKAGDLTFADNEKYFGAAESSGASAIIIGATAPATTTKSLIQVANVRVAVAQILPLFFPPDDYPAGIDPTARVHPSAEIDSTAHIGPHCAIGARVRIGAKSVLMGGNHLGSDCQLADDVRLFPNVVLYRATQIGRRVIIHSGTVIGSDGYGYVFDQGRHQKVLQVGNVIIEDDVEIGANAAVDRAAFGSTTIGAGTKIDNLVHVAHNVVMGKNCLVMGQCGFAGSTQLGDYAVIASQSGIAGHLKLGRQATVGAKSGVMRDVGDGETVLGIPAQPHQEMKRQWISMQRLPDMTRRLRDLEKQVQELRAQTKSSAL